MFHKNTQPKYPLVQPAYNPPAYNPNPKPSIFNPTPNVVYPQPVPGFNPQPVSGFNMQPVPGFNPLQSGFEAFFRQYTIFQLEI